MKNITLILLALGLFLPGYSFAALQDIHLEWSYDTQPVEGKALTGYSLYKDGTKVCSNSTPTERTMDCSFESEEGTFTFTLTSDYSDGSEGPHSAPYSFSIGSDPQPPTPGAPIATISPTALTGEAPLAISFDGTSSAGAVSHAWMFGDGDTANGSQASHIFSTAGTYTTTLTVTNAEGLTDTANVTITVKQAIAENTPPTAVIGSTTTLGEAPLDVSFNGLASHDAEEQISSFLWNFGDGTQSTTPTAAHTYTTAGTYTASLTVTDSQGSKNTTSTPIVVTAPETKNENPTAELAVSVSRGSIPLTVTFDGSASTDPESSNLTYSWNFGDGTTDQNVSVSHTYTNPGSFAATLTVTDEMGATASTTIVISAEAEPEFQMELGEVEIDHNWVRVSFDNSFTNPVVVAGAPSSNDTEPCVIRMRNIDATGFDIRLQEWDYLDGSHARETVAYLTLEQGSYTLEDGTMIEAGQFTSQDTYFQAIPFDTAFTTEPVVMTSITTFEAEDTVTGRLRNISTTSFEHKTQEQASLLDGHTDETVSYIAWEPSRNSIGTINVIVDKTGDKVRNRWYTVDYGDQLTELPIFIGAMQSQDGVDTSTVRYTNKTNSDIQVKIEEEQSEDDETRHTSETVGYLLFSQNSEPATKLSIAVNFQPDYAETPLGYVADSGGGYDTERGYGWLVSPPTNIFDRDHIDSPDQSYDTQIKVYSDATWEIDVPNGDYNVTVLVGDPTYPYAVHNVQIESLDLINNEKTNKDTVKWLEKSGTFTVIDGRLTMTFLESMPFSKICRIHISAVN